MKIFKKSLAVFLILTFLYSSALTNIFSFLGEVGKNSKIVDALYFSSENRNVVDKLVPLNNYLRDFNTKIAEAAAGSGTITVVPAFVDISTATATSFTFTSAESMNSGEVVLYVPSGWTVPQSSNSSVAGYTQLATTSAMSATTILGHSALTSDQTTQTFNIIGGGNLTLTEDDTDMCNTAGPALDTTVKTEGLGSILCTNSGSAATDATDTYSFDYAATANWSSYDFFSTWIRATVGLTSTNGASFAWDDTATMASLIGSSNLGTVNANTWTNVIGSLSGTRTAIKAFGWMANGTGFDSKNVYTDEVLLGATTSPYILATSTGYDLRIRTLRMANGEGFRFDYGTTSNGLVTTPSTAGVYTFTTLSRPSASVATATLASHPSIRVKGTITAADHDVGSQVINKFTSGGTSTSSAELYRFKLTPNGETASTTLTFDFTTGNGISASDFASVSIIVDANNNGVIDAGEATTAFGTPTISGSTMLFNSTTTISSATNYVMRGSVNNLSNGDSTTISLSGSNIVAFGASSQTFTAALGGRLTVTGTLTDATHTRTDLTTTLGDGTDPSNSTIAPSASATEIDRFTFIASSGSDTVTALTVTLSPANAYTNIATVDVQTDGGVSKCSATPSSNTVELTSCGISVTTSSSEYKIMITPKSHANMAAPATGASYATTATVTAWTGTNTQAGSDTDSATITVDNASPANASSVTVSNSTEGENSLSWSNPADSDFSEVIILRRTGVAVSDTPTEGATYSVSDAVGSSVVVCKTSSTSCTESSVSSGTEYNYKIFAKDSRGNYSDAGVVPTGSPITPASATLTLQSYRFFTNADSYTPGSALADQDTSYQLASDGDQFRMRMLIRVDTKGINTNGRTMKLQYAAKSGTCDTSFTGETYADVTAATPISYYNNTSLTDGTALGAQGDMTDSARTIVNQTYEESNNFSNSEASIASGQDGKWDFSLYENGADANTSYCLRVVKSDGSTLDSYTIIPEIVTAAGNPAIDQLHYRWRADNGSETGASYIANEDTALASYEAERGSRQRLRFLVNNSGVAAATNYNWKLEYSSSTCTTYIPTASYGQSSAGLEWEIEPTAYLTDGGVTTDSASLTNPAGSFTSGITITQSNSSPAHTLPASNFTELEYSMKSTSFTYASTNYCFKLTNAGSTAHFTYTVVPQISLIFKVRSSTSGGNAGAALGGENNGSGEIRSGGNQGGGSQGSGGEGSGSGSGQTGGNQGGGGGGSGGLE